MPPKALSISQVTRMRDGLFGSRRSRPSARSAGSTGSPFHMDGARFANALVVARLHAGRDDLEAGCRHPVLRRHQERLPDGRGHRGVRSGLAEALDYRAKRAGQIISKGRLIAAQFEGYFANDHWLDNARHANRDGAGASRKGSPACPACGSRWPTRGQRGLSRSCRSAPWTRRLRAARHILHAWTELSLPPDRARRLTDEELDPARGLVCHPRGRCARLLQAASGIARGRRVICPPAESAAIDTAESLDANGAPPPSGTQDHQ